MRRRWDYRGIGSTITLSNPTAHADGVPTGPHEVGWVCRGFHLHQVACALGKSQPDADETKSGTLNRGADILSRTVGDKESLAVTNPGRDHNDPDCYCRTESINCHPVADYQPFPDCQPVAVLVPGERGSGNRRRLVVLVGTGGFVACSRDSDSPSRASAPSTSLDG